MPAPVTKDGKKAGAGSGLPLDWVDLLSGPAFVATMLWEYRALKDRPHRRLGDMDHLTRAELSDPSLPPDPLVPVGYERRDTAASLTMLAGNVAVNLAYAGVLAKANGWLFRHRVADVGRRRWSFAAAMVAWDFLYYWSHRWQHEHRIFWGRGSCGRAARGTRAIARRIAPSGRRCSSSCGSRRRGTSPR